MIGIDVGGANLKIVDGDDIIIHYCPLWQESPIAKYLKPYAGRKAAVVMSGELADGFASKEEGIAFIVNAVRSVIPDARFYGTDGEFHTTPCISLAAANWLASADYLRAKFPESVFVDMGSTTTDIIPLSSFERLLSLRDLDRLQRGMLVYTGLLRAPVASLLREVYLNCGVVRTLVANELFAISADVHLVMGHIGKAEYAVPTPDCAGVMITESLQRLARMVCSDLSEIGEENARAVAAAFWDEQRSVIEEEILRASGSETMPDLICAGIGSALLAETFGGRDLSDIYGTMTDAFPAFAVREVAKRNAEF
ncbi:hydantoinase/oxoprolinase family protein [Methanogenium sp. MK-MG]|uniref:hydantoinase/oxoprolinase family protein n=1 Tax=Methanogenium sp. MK-MG TaxID=2599926 RepID=UPI0013EDD332|nr:hydantoinase/oxoprolinase family protein [Methanogenium sp. MK-MG]KAF1075251.1 (4-{4-(2-(gamma-L-glutamylamino)ethyl)phenoxymethyl}furan-2-yl)methanamine synthase [Methanogenium sp. MK-MG]